MQPCTATDYGAVDLDRDRPSIEQPRCKVRAELKTHLHLQRDQSEMLGDSRPSMEFTQKNVDARIFSSEGEGRGLHRSYL